MRAALDTNVLVYAEGLGDATRCGQAVDLVRRLDPRDVLLPAQALGELYRVLTAKDKRDAPAARQAVLSWVDGFEVADSCAACFISALDLCADHGLQIWDALILAVAAENRCRLLLSEDLHAGFTWQGVTIVNPFQQPVDPLLARLLR